MHRRFSDTDNNPVGFKSYNLERGESHDKESQTSVIHCTDEGTQCGHKANTEVQTDEVVKTYENSNYDEGKLASFLSGIAPLLFSELDKVERNKAFTSYLNTEENSSEVKELYKLKYCKNLIKENVDVLAMSWSCTGSTIALGCGHKKHLDWCMHRSHVRFYNINKYDFDGSEPIQVVPTPSCVTAIAMHPYEPLVLAVGTYSGDILVWNLRQEEKVSLENQIRHNDCVTQLAWISVNSQLLLVSSSLDGHMFVFKVMSTVGSVILEDKYLLGECIQDIKQYPGISCFSFSPLQQGVFIVGLEGGTLLQCSLLASTTKIKEGDGAIMKDPKVQTISEENQLVTCITFSSYEDLFVVATATKKCLLYRLNESEPTRIFWADFNIYGAAWSPSQANIVICWGAKSAVEVYNCNSSSHVATLEPETSHEESQLLIHQSVYNTKSPRLLAVSLKGGRSYIWEVPVYFKVK